jgi:hypothetical protein
MHAIIIYGKDPSGTFYIDEIKARDDDTTIGAAINRRINII